MIPGRRCAVALIVCFSAHVALAQGATPPLSSAPAAQRPQQSGDVGARLQQLVQGSGMTPDQIRARLQAQGYSQGMLDSYLGGNAPPGAPNANVFAAMSAIGLASSADIEALSGEARGQAKARGQLDAALIDSLGRLMEDDPSFREALRSMATSRASAKTQVDSGFQMFGMETFRRTTNEFEPDATGPVPNTYRLGPGDQLALVLTGAVQAYYPLTVTPEGLIFIPDVGEIAVANLTMQQLQDVLYTRLGRVHSAITRNPAATARFDVTVTRMGSTQVLVHGDVATPGAYKVSKLGTVLTALYAAGGPTANGTMRRVELRRGERLIGALDLYDYFTKGSASGALPIQNGDVVFVPPRRGQVRIAGTVTRPATYELSSNERLGELVRMAGGFRAEADHRRVQIERIVPPSLRTAPGMDRRVFDVSSAALDSSQERLEPGDVVRVFAIASRVANRVTVSGNVWSGGVVAFVPGMRLSTALRLSGGIRPDTYRGAVQLSRLESDGSRSMLRVALRDSIGTPADDIALQPDDEIQVFSVTGYRPDRYVAISGAVRRPGQVVYSEGMTLRDLVMLAGGLDEGALLERAEVARMPEDRLQGALATTVNVPLDSTYLLERGTDGRYLGPPGLAAQRSGAADIKLKPYDNVLVLRQPDFVLPQMVTITGEVRFPGRYAIRTKGERLADLIARIGGLTPRADTGAVIYTRTRPVSEGTRRRVLATRRLTMADSDAEPDATSEEPGVTRRIGVDLRRALRSPNSPENLVLLNGDAINVPPYAPLVSVEGAVNSPVIVAYVAGANIDYYVRAAGGESINGNGRRAYVVQPSGKVETPRRRLFLFRSRPTPRAGSIVTVPQRPPAVPKDLSVALATATSILTSILALTTLIRQ